MHLDTGTTAVKSLNRRVWLSRISHRAGGIAGGAVVPRAGTWFPVVRQRTGGQSRQADAVSDRLHDPAVFSLPARSGPRPESRRPAIDHVAWGTTHKEGAAQVPVIAADAPPAQAKELGKKCRDLGLEPLMMFSGVYPEAGDALDVLKARIRQAAAAGIPHVLTFGHTQGGNRKLWVERFKQLGPMARDHGVTIVVKQHGGETGTGAACAAIIREVDDEGIKVNYDAGNVMDYLDVDPIPDIRACAEEVRGFCIKDHRNFPKDEDCGPGFGEIDHYRLLQPVAFTGRDDAALLREHLRPGDSALRPIRRASMRWPAVLESSWRW